MAQMLTGGAAELLQSKKKKKIEPNPGTKNEYPRVRCTFLDP